VVGSTTSASTARFQILRRQRRLPSSEGDAKDPALMTKLLADCDHFVAAAAMIAGSPTFTSSPTT